MSSRLAVTNLGELNCEYPSLATNRLWLGSLRTLGKLKARLEGPVCYCNSAGKTAKAWAWRGAVE